MWSMLWMPLAAAPDQPARDARSHGADEALVAAFKGGDVRAFDALVARYSQPIFGYIYRSVGDPALAEELTQDVGMALSFRRANRSVTTPHMQNLE